MLHRTKEITFDVYRYNSISYYRISTQDLIYIQYENEYDYYTLVRYIHLCNLKQKYQILFVFIFYSKVRFVNVQKI